MTKKGGVHVLKLTSYTSPKVRELTKEGWVQYGEGDKYYQHLIDLFHTSPTNNAAIQGISDMIYGDGLHVNMVRSSVNDYAKIMSLFPAEEVRRVCHDLKLFGHAAFQVNFDRGQVSSVYHIARNTIRPSIMNDDGEIDSYFFCHDWTKVGKKGFAPEQYPAYGFQRSGDKIAILSVDSYSVGSVYFSPCDYQGGVQYAELEGEIANYHLNNIKNGLSPSFLLNFNNGVPTPEEQDDIERDINRKWGGSNNSGRTIIAFNDDKERAATIEAVQLSDAHNQYQFLSTECMTKIMVSHRITSPMLLGIKDNTGFGNNAQEMATAYDLFKNVVIRPFRSLVIEAMNKVLYDLEITAEIAFKDLMPISQPEEPAHSVHAETQLSVKTAEIEDRDAQFWIDYLEGKGEQIDLEEYELVYEAEVEDPDETDEQFYTLFKRFADPDEKSKDDSGIYKVRYRYTPMKTTKDKSGKDVSRPFCTAMVAAAKGGVYYRRDDIDKMSKDGVNGEWSKKGESTYDIWRFKGGGACRHRWYRMVFKRKQIGGKVKPLDSSEKGSTKRNIDKNYDEVGGGQAKRAGVPKKALEPAGYKEAITKPNDMPNRGFVTRNMD